MAERKPLFMSSEGFSEEMAQADSATFGGLTLGGNIAMGSNKITGLGSATADGDALAYGQTGADLNGLTSDADITLTGGAEVTGLPASPSGDTAAASKAYVDSVAQGLDVHESVVVATTTSGTLANDFEDGDAIDGVTLATGDRILIKDQGNTENGIYVVQASGAPVRADDWASGYAAAGAFVFVEEGTVNQDSGWVCTNDQGSDVTNTDTLTFSQFSGAGQITAGAGLTKSGNTLNVGAGNGITVNANDVQVDIDTESTTTTEANAIALGANGINIKVDNATIEGSGQGAAGAESLRVKADGIDGTHLADDIDITTTGDIQANSFTGDGSGLTNLPTAGSADAVSIQAKKSTAGTINVGQVVHLVGWNGTEYTVELADADNSALMPAIGIATSTVTDAAAGTIVVFGYAAGLNTASWSAGDSLYVSTTPGALTNTRPTGATTLVQRLGEVASSHASTGIIQVQGAGRSNDIPNIANDKLWVGDATGVGVEHTIGDGLEATAGSELQVNITADKGLHFNSGALEIEIDDTPDTLDADADGLKVVGVPALFKIGGTAVGATVTAANLDTLSDGSNADSLHVHAAMESTEAPRIENTLTTATDATSNGDPVYVNGNGTIGKADSATNAKARVIGVIRSGSGSAGATPEVVSEGLCAGVLSGATAGTPYYLQSGGGIGTSLPTGGNRVILVGYAYNATDLWVTIHDYGRKAA